MPKKTFFNLEEEKQANILEQSIKIFSESSYNEVKIAALIRAAGIPRTSFYDYFEDKLDLYSYIILMVSEKKNVYMKNINFEGNFFSDLNAYFEAGLRFMIDEPALDAISKQFLKEPDLIGAIFGEQSMDVSGIFKDMLKKGIAEGSVRPDINLEFMALTLSVLTGEVMLNAVQSSDESLDKIIKSMSKDILEFIQFGIGK